MYEHRTLIKEQTSIQINVTNINAWWIGGGGGGGYGIGTIKINLLSAT